MHDFVIDFQTYHTAVMAATVNNKTTPPPTAAPTGTATVRVENSCSVSVGVVGSGVENTAEETIGRAVT